VVALAAGFIRMGNWFNSEIYGAPANSAFETVFVEDGAQAIQRGFADQVKHMEFEPTGELLQTDSLALPELDLRISFHQSGEAQTAQYANTYLPQIIRMQRPDNRNLWMLDGTVSEVYEGADGWEASVKVYGIPRYPTQLFEAGAYWIIFITLALLYLKRGAGNKPGFLLGLFLTLLFGFRFFIEYLKEIQVDFEQSMSLNMGQWLSIPLAAFGLFLIFRAQKTS
jgi:prolipoprotein diacylglyceryltransferase